MRRRVRPYVPLVVYEHVAIYDFLETATTPWDLCNGAAVVIHSCCAGEFAQLHTYKLYL